MSEPTYPEWYGPVWEDWISKRVEGGTEKVVPDAGSITRGGIRQVDNPDIDVRTATPEQLKAQLWNEYLQPREKVLSGLDPDLRILASRFLGNAGNTHRNELTRLLRSGQISSVEEFQRWGTQKYDQIYEVTKKKYGYGPEVREAWQRRLQVPGGEPVPMSGGSPVAEPQGQTQQTTPNQMRDDKGVDIWMGTQLPNIMDYNTRMSNFNERRAQMLEVLGGMNAPQPVKPIKDPYENKMAFVGAILRGKTQEALETSAKIATQNASIAQFNTRQDLDFEMRQLGMEAQLLDGMQNTFMNRYREVAYGGEDGGTRTQGGRVNSRYGGGGVSGVGQPWLTPAKYGAQGQRLEEGKVDIGWEYKPDPSRPDKALSPREVSQLYAQQAYDFISEDGRGRSAFFQAQALLQGMDPETGEKLKGDGTQQAIQGINDFLQRADIPENKRMYIRRALEDELGISIPAPGAKGGGGAGGGGGDQAAVARRQTNPWLTPEQQDRIDAAAGPVLDKIGGVVKTADTAREILTGGFDEGGGPTAMEQERLAELERYPRRDTPESPTARFGDRSIVGRMTEGQEFSDMDLDEMMGQGYDIAAKAAASDTKYLSAEEVTAVAVTAAGIIDVNYQAAGVDDEARGTKGLIQLVTGERRSNGERRRLTKSAWDKRMKQFISRDPDEVLQLYGADGQHLQTILRNVGPRRSGVITKQLYESIDMPYIRAINTPREVPTTLDTIQNPGGYQEPSQDEMFDFIFGSTMGRQ